jgi:hypothetical protein
MEALLIEWTAKYSWFLSLFSIHLFRECSLICISTILLLVMCLL